MAFRALLLCFLIGRVAAANEKAKVTPIQKVLQLMGELRTKAETEKKQEEVRFSAFNQWCKDIQRTKTNEIEAGNAKIEQLNAKIEKATVHIKKLTERIQELEEDVGRWKKDEKSATTVREAEQHDYKLTFIDYTESITALEQAINVLKKQDYARAQASLLQVRSLKTLDTRSKQVLDSFLQQPSELEYQAPEAAAYESQSGGVLDMLDKLQDKFTTEKRALEKEELMNKNAYQQIMQQLADDIENAEFEIEKKSKERAETEQKKAELEGDLAQTTTERDEDQKYLEDTVTLCEQKAADFASRQKLREEEIAAIDKAIEIIGSKTVAGAGEKYLPSFAQSSQRQGVFAQLRSASANPMQQQLVMFLNQQAKKTGSKLLADIAMQAEASPFKKVLKMIQQLIFNLQEEATDEAEHHGWCQTELTTNKQTREKKTAEVNDLTTTIEDLTADIQQLAQDIAAAEKAIKELDAAMAEATTDRLDSKAENAETIKAAQEAQVAVQEAIAVLKDFYAKSAEATALNQQTPAEDAPETFDKSFKGNLVDGGGIVDFLEVILSDFQRLESETAAAEEQEEESYKEFMFESKKNKALKENEIKLKSETKTDKESQLQQAQEDLKITQQQLNEALAYYDKLKPQCVDSGITYEERVKRREEEIQALQEALKILSGTDLPTKGSGEDLPGPVPADAGF
jgi:outer membrane murein-binding lipoprotein Lpp